MTAQAAEIIFLNTKPHLLHSTPLETLFDRIGWRPKFYKRCTANYRGYTARWEIIGRQLYLTGIVGAGWIVPAHLQGKLQHDPDDYDGFPPDARTMRLQDLFPGQGSSVPATWVTGVLTVPTGGLLAYVHAGFASLYSQYLLVNVVQGHIRQIRDLPARRWAERVGRSLPDDWFDEDPEPIADDLFEPRAFFYKAVDRDGGSWAYERAEVVKLLSPCASRPGSQVQWPNKRDASREAKAWLCAGRR